MIENSEEKKWNKILEDVGGVGIQDKPMVVEGGGWEREWKWGQANPGGEL